MTQSGTLTATKPGNDAASTYRIIDTDQHSNPPATFWKDYLPEKFRDRAPQLEHAEDADYIVFEGRRRKINLLNALAGTDAKDFKAEGRLSDMRDGVSSVAGRLADMDADGIDVSVMYGGGPLGTSDTELYFESFRAYNRYINDYCDRDRKRLYPVGYIPLRDVDESISLLREVAGMGFTSVNIPAFPQARTLDGQSQSLNPQTLALTGDPNGELQFDSPEMDRFWATACELDLAITIHLGARATRFTDKTRFLSDLLLSKFAMAEPVAIMIFGGVFDRFPDLRFGTIESGGGWMAFASDYMDRTWEKQRYWTGSKLKNPPSHYMDRNVYTSFIHDRIAIECCHMPGAKNVMWSSDYPHSETTFPDSQGWIERLFKDISEADKRAILHDNACKFFRIAD